MKQIDSYSWFLQKDFDYLNKLLPNDIINQLEISNKTVIGIDIYKYSKKEENQQKLIPFIFDILYRQTEKWLNEYEIEFFKTNYIELRKDFIHTGDGGFQIVDNPIYGILFILYFYTALSLYNNNQFLYNLHNIVEDIEIRSCMTLGNVYHYDNNYFGKPII